MRRQGDHAQPGWIIGVDDRVGSIGSARMQIWSSGTDTVVEFCGSQQVLIDGDVYFDRSLPSYGMPQYREGNEKTALRCRFSVLRQALPDRLPGHSGSHPCLLGPSAASRTHVLKGGKLLTVSRRHRKGVLVMEGGKITGLGSAGSVKVPSDGKLVDVTG